MMSEEARTSRHTVCRADLPTWRATNEGVVLVTSATRHIEGRLLPAFVAQGYEVLVTVWSAARGCDDSTWQSGPIHASVGNARAMSAAQAHEGPFPDTARRCSPPVDATSRALTCG